MNDYVTLEVIVGVILLCIAISHFILKEYKKSFSIQIHNMQKRISFRENEASRKERKLKEFERSLDKKATVLAEKETRLADQEHHINDLVRQRIADTVLNLTKRDYLALSPVFTSISSSPDTNRLISSLSQDLKIQPPFEASAQVRGSGGDLYSVSLRSCTCKDFALHGQPCKHMYRLATELGALLSYDFTSLQDQVTNLNDEAQQAEALISKAVLLRKQAKEDRLAVRKIAEDLSQEAPWLSKQFADYFALSDQKLEHHLRTKSPPAVKAADQVKELRTQKKLLQKQCKLYEYQLHFYETLFPWLEEFKELSPLDAYTAVQTADDEYSHNEVDSSLRNWLSPDEYQKLPPCEKFQLALDRYQRRGNKTSWEIGVEYERYIGYLCEQRGFHVKYTGATFGLEDMGRDLIATKDNQCYIIQCKRWSREKTIHEKHIFQLFGSSVLYETAHPEQTVTAVFVTTAILSDLAKNCSKKLGISLFENVPPSEYPLIKCNISKSGEKIYHLPFDQQYDRIIVDTSRGEKYASTVAEAEQSGFRRAFRHQPA